MRILFLDFDGVVCGDTGRLKPNAACIAAVNHITKSSGAKIVISSSWRHAASLEKWRKILRAWGITAEVIGLTPSVHKAEVTRGDEIAAWLADSKNVEGFVILDDAEVLPFFVQHVQTQKSVGLTAADADRAIALLLKD